MKSLSATLIDVGYVGSHATFRGRTDEGLTAPLNEDPAPLCDDDLIRSAQRAGMARARSSSRAAWLAMLAVHEVASVLVGKETCINVVSATAALSVAYRFERAGWCVGWNVADPFWLPYAIPTGSPTSILSALKLRGAALAFPGGVQGFFAALDHGLLSLKTRQFERVVVVVTEDNLDLIEDFSTRTGHTLEPRSDTFAIVLGLDSEEPRTIVRDYPGSPYCTRPDIKYIEVEPHRSDLPAACILESSSAAHDAATEEEHYCFTISSTRESFVFRLLRTPCPHT